MRLVQGDGIVLGDEGDARGEKTMTTKQSMDYERVTMSQALFRSAAEFPRYGALNYMGKRISYRSLNRYVNRFARALADMGIAPGDKVAVCLPNIPQAVIANYAVFRIGAVAVPVNPMYTDREMILQIGDSNAKAVVVLDRMVFRMETIRAETKLETIIACRFHAFLSFVDRLMISFAQKERPPKTEAGNHVRLFEKMIRKYSAKAYPDKSAWDEVGAIVYTGGTTGVSKGVMLTHANLSCNVQQFAAWFSSDIQPGVDRLLGTFPFYHSAGFTGVQNFAVWMAFEVILVPRPAPNIHIDLIQKYKPTFISGVPAIFSDLLAHPTFQKMDLSFVKAFFSGAAPLPWGVIRDVNAIAGVDIYEVYGLTETAPIVAAAPWGGPVRPSTVGRPVPDTDIRIMDMLTGRKEMHPGEEGEIAVKGPQVMKGYYKRPKETRDVMRDGWFYTGDVGRFDEEGYLTIVDRIKDMIIVGGFNVYPIEIDHVLSDHPEIEEVCTIGIPDDRRGESVKTFVVTKTDSTLTESDVIAYCREHLAAYKVPRQVGFLEALPKSALGKILRRKLRDMEKGAS